MKVTSRDGFTFQKGSGLKLMVYADPEYAPSDRKRKSASGVAVMCGGVAIQSICRTQKRTTL